MVLEEKFDSSIMRVGIVCRKGVHFEMDNGAKIKYFFALQKPSDLQLVGQDPSSKPSLSEFIKGYFTEQGYSINKNHIQDSCSAAGNVYINASRFEGDGIHRISVHVSAGSGNVGLNYHGKNLSELPRVNQLILEMIEKYENGC